MVTPMVHRGWEVQAEYKEAQGDQVEQTQGAGNKELLNFY